MTLYTCNGPKHTLVDSEVLSPPAAEEFAASAFADIKYNLVVILRELGRSAHERLWQ